MLTPRWRYEDAARADRDDVPMLVAACEQCGEATVAGETFCSTSCEDERREEDQRGDAIAAREAADRADEARS